MNDNVVMFLVFICLFCRLTTSTSNSTLTPGQSIKDNNNDTLISAAGMFQLGFFSPGDSRNRYLGIWYNTKIISIRTVVWVANRQTAISGSSGVLSMTSQGMLRLSNKTNSIFWSSNTSRRPLQNPVAELVDSGNLVVRDGDDNILWQSFDHPTDTLLPGMKLGKDFITGKETFSTSWKTADDPAPGEFSMGVDSRGVPQLVITKGPEFYFRAGSWNGISFTGVPELKKNDIYSFEFIFNEKEAYYTYQLYNTSHVSRIIVKQEGPLQRLVWIDRTKTWLLLISSIADNCDNYALCGAYGSCNIQGFPVCGCLEGFVPKSARDWSLLDWTDGCVRRTKLSCGSQDGFQKHTGIKLPDTSFCWLNRTMSLEMCREKCLKNCSCTAYANSDIRGGGSGCLLWFNDLMDIREFSEGGQDLYIRMAASELVSLKDSKNSSKNKKVELIVMPVILIGLILGGLIYLMWKKLQKQEDRSKKSYNIDGGNDDLELPVFDLDTIVKATDNFSDNNKLGQGGFGPVYKGTLPDGQELAVKRLSKSSCQGSVEFKNEVGLIAKLQHRNLVRLLGCCIQGDEKMLVYEYMPNKSLDYFIFDQTKGKLLDWRRRMHIIDAIARGLLYLHQDSRLRIIHRDLKASNVLLDNDMNPKISDFGMARTVWGDQTEANTNRVVGTYGYMPPEYAVDGLFSIKSDVFSFGVLVLEILSGKKNRGFSHPDHSHNLLGHAWKLWMEKRPLQLIDSNLGDCFVVPEVLRCIHVSLLCVQKRLEDRPNMSSIVLMFGSESPLPQPKEPGFFTERNLPEPASVNDITISMLEAR